MDSGGRGKRAGGWIKPILRDIQFWVPLAVLLGGLLLLRFIR